jgi:hypothetical protein
MKFFHLHLLMFDEQKLCCVNEKEKELEISEGVGDV